MRDHGDVDMERVNGTAVVFLPWASIEAEAQKQILNTASMPFVFRHVAVMPDCHYGKGATIGTVLATKDAVIPAAVGVDIGCGMIAVRTPLTRSQISNPAAVRAARRAPGVCSLHSRFELGATVRAAQSERNHGPRLNGGELCGLRRR